MTDTNHFVMIIKHNLIQHYVIYKNGYHVSGTAEGFGSNFL